MLLLLQTSDGFIDATCLVGLVLISLKLALALSCLLGLLVLPMLEFSLTVASQVLLRSYHGILHVLDTAHFLIELTLYLFEDTDALTVLSLCLLHLGEDSAQFVAEAHEVLVDLGRLVESDDLLRVVSDGHDEAKSVALVEKPLNLVPVTIEVHHLLQRGEAHVGEEVLALLNGADGQSLLDEGSVLGQVGHDLTGLL